MSVVGAAGGGGRDHGHPGTVPPDICLPADGDFAQKLKLACSVEEAHVKSPPMNCNRRF